MTVPPAGQDGSAGGVVPVAPSGGAGDDVPFDPAPSPRKAIVLALAVAACVAVVAATPLREFLGPETAARWRRHVDALGAWGPVVFLVVNAVAVAVGVPRLLFAALGGALFGWIVGAALAHYGGFLGSWMTFAAGRSLGREWVAGALRRRWPRADRFLAFVGRHGFLANVLVRVAPVGHAFTASLLMSVSPVSPRDFLLGTFVGTLPHSVVFALLGSAAKGDLWVERLLGGAAALVVLSLLVAAWVRRVAARARGETSVTGDSDTRR